MDREEAIRTAERFAERVANEFHPVQILLFGSYLDGTYRENSDIDVAIVFDKESEPENWWKAAIRMQTIRREIKARKIEPHLMEPNSDPKSFEHHVMEVGQVLYPKA